MILISALLLALGGAVSYVIWNVRFRDRILVLNESGAEIHDVRLDVLTSGGLPISSASTNMLVPAGTLGTPGYPNPVVKVAYRHQGVARSYEQLTDMWPSDVWVVAIQPDGSIVGEYEASRKIRKRPK